jgi:hypothetical protein
MTKKTASASYWVVIQDATGPTLWMWNCETCPVVGTSSTEKQTVRDMNKHVADEHSAHEYAAPPIPKD